MHIKYTGNGQVVHLFGTILQKSFVLINISTNFYHEELKYGKYLGYSTMYTLSSF
jgi:hypothetical protein